jgi:hypothetical protein
MRTRTRLLLLSLLIAYPGRAVVTAQTAADDIPVTIRWNRLVPRFIDENPAPTRPRILFRVYTLLSVAQYGAVNSAKGNRAVSPEISIASASATVLTELFTDSTVRASIARELARDIDRARTGSHGADRAIAGKSLGEDIARRVLASSPAANFMAPWKGTIPKGPGIWYSAPGIPPLGIALTNARTLLLDSAAQFRPGPPLPYGSPAFQAALDEVRRVARERTPEQTKIAQKWNSVDPWAPWNETASAALRRHHASDAEAARVYAVLNAASSDAMIACFEAKYHYWSIRPSQADTTLVLADDVSLPNFPSYPSGHACSAGAFDAVLGHFFPDERAEFTRIAEEQAMSRLYGGIHYRFDNDGGLALGRVVARHAVEQERRGALNAWSTAGVARKP